MQKESALYRQDPVLQVRDGLRAYIAGCMSGRGAMAGAGCGIACKCSIFRIQTHFVVIRGKLLLLATLFALCSLSCKISTPCLDIALQQFPLELQSIAAQEPFDALAGVQNRTGIALERRLTRPSAGAGAIMSSSASRIRAESTADCLRYSMQLGKLVMSTEPDIARPSGGGLKSSALRHCSHTR